MLLVIGLIGWYEVGDIVVDEEFFGICIEDWGDVDMWIVIGNDYGVWVLIFIGKVLILCVVFVEWGCVLVLIVLDKVMW